MSESESNAQVKPRAIVAGHGEFAAGLVSAVQQITGRGNIFRTISARDLSAADLEGLLRRSIEETGVTVVFTDLQAGSCTMATRRYLKNRSDVLLVAGVNLPMLVRAFTYRMRGMDTLIKKAVSGGCEGVLQFETASPYAPARS